MSFSDTYRKKPVEIEAADVDDLLHCFKGDWSALPTWVSAAYETGVIRAITSDGFICGTLEGPYNASREDMLILGVAGEIYPCKKGIFALTYEAVE